MSETPSWQLNAPAGDGELLLWPDPRTWADLARRSAEAMDTDTARLAGLALADARRRARRGLHLLDGNAPSAGACWIVTGHQTFPYHPGIWAKNAAIDALARTCDASAAVNINVDHDLPHAGNQLAWPALDDAGRLARRGALPLDGQLPFERQPAPTPDALADACRRIEADLSPLLPTRAGCPFADAAADGAFGRWFARTRAAADRGLGLDLAETLSSDLDESEAFLLFAADMIARAGEASAAYNRALAEARKTTGHSIAPDLAADDAVELPFWTLRADTPGRQRLLVRPGGGIQLADEIGVLGELSAAALGEPESAVDALRRLLADTGANLRPRALTLTLFARLLLADLFVHGTGGGRYDVATDGLFRSLYGLEPPPFAVVSATLQLPVDAATATADQLRQATRTLRDMRFNPQRHLAESELRHDPAAALVAAKWEAVERNQALRSAETDTPPSQVSRERANLFTRIRELNRDLTALLDSRIAEQQQRVEQLANQAEAGQVADARDYYYALQPAGRLEQLRDHIRDRVR